MSPAISDERCMDEVLLLANRGAGWTNTNPMVGAVIAKNGRIVARGFHRRAGGAHAEIEALKAAGQRARGATLYANLEPCAHIGKTPPCTDAIIKAGIRRIVCSAKDPDPRVNGRGIAKLRRAGIAVRCGVRAREARALNEAFLPFHAKRRPFVALKFAASLDGKLATRAGDSKWLTNDAARAYARSLRGRYHAVLVGAGTALADDPPLGVRPRGKRDPVRVILDPRLRVPLSARALRGNAIVAASLGAPRRKKKTLERRGITVISFKSARIPLRALLAKLRTLNIVSVLVEGGGETLGRFIDEKLFDRVYAFHAPLLVGGRKAVSIGGLGTGTLKHAVRLHDVSVVRFDDNVLISGRTP